MATLVVWLTVFVGAAEAPAAGPALTDEPVRLVLTADSAIEIVERVPAADLQGVHAPFLHRYLLARLGKASLAGKGPPVRFVIEAKAALWNQLPPADLTSVQEIDAFEVTVSPAQSSVRVTANTMLGAGFGLCHLLEKHFGVRWLFPGELGTVVPGPGEVILKPSTERCVPAMASRTYTGLRLAQHETMLAFRRTAAGKQLSAERHFFEARDYFKSLRLHYLTHASHNMFHIFPPEKYGTTSPDLYPLKEGKRFIPPGRNAWHPCYSNPKAREIAVAAAREAFDAGMHCFSLGINDGRRVQCQCDACRGAGWPSSYFNFVQAVAAAVKDRYPPHIIGVLAYGDVKVPTPELRLPDNVLVLVTGGRLQPWVGHAKHLGAYEWAIGVGNGVPLVPLRAMQENAAAYRRVGALTYHAEMHPVWAFDAPRVFVQSRLLWESRLDAHATLRDFCTAAFGPGGGAMERFFSQWSALRDRDVPRDGFFLPLPMDLWRHSQRQFDAVPLATYENTEQMLAEAERMPLSPAQAARLRMVRCFADYSHNVWRMNHLPREVFKVGAAPVRRALFDELLACRTRREALRAQMRQHPEWFLGASEGLDEFDGRDWEGYPGWTVNNEVDCALKTLLVHAVAEGRAADLSKLPADLKPLAVPTLRMPLKLAPRKSHGWYTEEKAVTMPGQRSGDGLLRWRTQGPTDQRILAGTAGEGRYKQHVGLGIASFAADVSPRRLLQLELTLSGRKGEAVVHIVNHATNMGWAPVIVPHRFGITEQTVAIRMVIEPVYPGSKWMEQATSHDIHVLWTPDADDSKLDATCRAVRLNLARPK